MKVGWQAKPFDDCIEKVKYTTKIQRKDFLGAGGYPVVSQEDAFINGYWDEADDLFRLETPLVVFGDHTKTLKYIDFDFVLGADGVKLLQPKEFLVPKFFYYQLQTANLDSLGYARHYKLLKELEIKYPDRVEQHRIVALLDAAFNGIAKARANAEKNLQNARALFESHLQSVFTERGEGWSEKRLGEVCSFSSGGTPSKANNSYWSGTIPWISGRDMKSERLSDAALHISQVAVDESSTRMAPAGALLILVRGMGLAHGPQIGELMTPCAFNQDIRAIHPERGIMSRFLLFALRTRIKNSKNVLSNAAHGTLKIDMDALKNVAIPVPSLEVQYRITQKIDALSSETQRLESLYQQKFVALDALKKSLLHQAFSGAL